MNDLKEKLKSKLGAQLEKAELVKNKIYKQIGIDKKIIEILSDTGIYYLDPNKISDIVDTGSIVIEECSGRKLKVYEYTYEYSTRSKNRHKVYCPLDKPFDEEVESSLI